VVGTGTNRGWLFRRCSRPWLWAAAFSSMHLFLDRDLFAGSWCLWRDVGSTSEAIHPFYITLLRSETLQTWSGLWLRSRCVNGGSAVASCCQLFRNFYLFLNLSFYSFSWDLLYFNFVSGLLLPTKSPSELVSCNDWGYPLIIATSYQ
jgi:hypothetical protein